MAKPVYATLKTGQRLGAVVQPDGLAAMVHVVGGPRLGGFLLSRFEGGRLTAATLAKLFDEGKR